VDILSDGKVIGSTRLDPGITMKVLREEETQLYLQTPHGDQWLSKDNVSIEREAIAAAPQIASAPIESLTEDLSSGDGEPKIRVPRVGKIYQATGINGANAIFLITEITPDRVAYEWRAPSQSSPEGDGGAGVLDLSNGNSTIEAGPVKVGWNTVSQRLEYYPERGTLVSIDLVALEATPWANPLAPRAKTLQETIVAERASLPQSQSTPAAPNRQSIPEITHMKTPYDDSPLAELRRLADSGDPAAQVELGHRNLFGKGLAKSYRAAAEWYQKASRSGLIEADMCLGRMHLEDLTDLEPEDWRNAFEVFDRLASGDSKSSKHFAGLCHLLGRGTPIDYEKAARRFTESIENPQRNFALGDSHWELGKMHENGTGFVKDATRAMSHFEQAALAGHEQARERLQVLSDEGVELATRALGNINSSASPLSPALSEDAEGNSNDLNPASAGLSFVLLDKPLHIGDIEMPSFANPRAEARDFKSHFDIRSLPQQDLQATVLVCHLVPRRHPDFLEGKYATKLLVNNIEVKILNDLLEGTEDSMEIVKLEVPIPRKFVRQGRNTLAIHPGKNGSNIDDFELRKIVIETPKAPVGLSNTR
jgi:TPR repeat protein